MKAIVYMEYGPPDVPQAKEVEKLAPKPGHFLHNVRMPKTLLCT
jgi:hypothetical protein